MCKFTKFLHPHQKAELRRRGWNKNWGGGGGERHERSEKYTYGEQVILFGLEKGGTTTW